MKAIRNFYPNKNNNKVRDIISNFKFIKNSQKQFFVLNLSNNKNIFKVKEKILFLISSKQKSLV